MTKHYSLLVAAVLALLAMLLAPSAMISQPYYDSHDARKIFSRNIASTAPSNGQALVWVASTSKWTPGSGAVSASATKLAANGANCSAGSYPLGVDDFGAVEGCTVVAAGGVTSLTPGASGALTWAGTTGALVPDIDTAYVPSKTGSNTISGAWSFTAATTEIKHLIGIGTAPTIASGFGTSPTIAGKDAAGRVTVGTGGIAVTGTVTFNVAWNTAPACTANNETSQLAAFATATTTTLVIASTTPLGVADKLTWICIGY